MFKSRTTKHNVNANFAMIEKDTRVYKIHRRFCMVYIIIIFFSRPIRLIPHTKTPVGEKMVHYDVCRTSSWLE